jgi:hypothetical protein
MDSPYVLRIIPFIFAVLTYCYTYKIGTTYFNRETGLLSIVILITTIPFNNFALQIRGYGLSTSLLIMLVYYCLLYLKDGHKRYLLFITGLTSLSLFTIPSNLYQIAGLTLYFVSIILIKGFKESNQNQISVLQSFVRSPYIKLVAGLALGCFIALLLYTPMFNDVFMNEYVKSGKWFQFSKFEYYVPYVADAVISGRWILIIIFVMAGFLGYQNYKHFLPKIFLFLLVCLSPFLIIFARGDGAPYRTFVVYMPLYSLILSAIIFSFWKVIFRNKKYNPLLIVGLLAYSLFVYHVQTDKISTKVFNDIHNEGRAQGLLHQYFTHHYQPLNDVNHFNGHYQKKPFPLVIYGCEPHGIPNYLEKFDIPYHFYGAVDSLLKVHDSIYIVTNHPGPFERNKEIEIELLNENYSYHNFLGYYQK